MRKQNYSIFFMASVAVPYVCAIEPSVLLPEMTIPRKVSSKDDWIPYFEKTRHITEPRHSLKNALDKYWTSGPGRAVDLGAGAGRDTIYLLNKGWDVHAIDVHKRSIEIIQERALGCTDPKLNSQVADFADMTLPANVDLMNASYSLPFCSSEHFSNCWTNIVSNITEGGVFVGQFFGLRDAWTWDATMTFLSYQQVTDLFKDQFEILYFFQEEGLTMTSDGESVTYRHCYHVIAKKISNILNIA